MTIQPISHKMTLEEIFDWVLDDLLCSEKSDSCARSRFWDQGEQKTKKSWDKWDTYTYAVEAQPAGTPLPTPSTSDTKSKVPPQKPDRRGEPTDDRYAKPAEVVQEPRSPGEEKEKAARDKKVLSNHGKGSPVCIATDHTYTDFAQP